MKKFALALCTLFAFLVLFKPVGYSEMSLDSNGNVGVGTTNPSAKLDVVTSNGNAVVGESTGNGVGIYGISTSGYAGYFEGDARVTGTLIVDGSLTGPGIGDITGVTAGAGLSGGGTSGDIILNADTNYLQRRVSSSCLEGSSIRTINTDGTVVCEPDNGSGGITTEIDPTVLSSVKDGVSWTEIADRPSGLDDGDDVGITSEIDPKIGSNITNYVPKWNGSALVSGSIYELNNGSLGIGLPSPKAKLHLYSTEGIGDPVYIFDAHMLRLESRGTPSAPLNTIQVIKSHNNAESELRFDNGDEILAAIYTLSNKRSLNFLVAGAGWNHMTVEDPNDIGDLEVHLRTDLANEAALIFNNLPDINIAEYSSKIYRPSNSNDLVVNLSGVGDVMNFSSTSGNVGIGATNPPEKLYVAGNIYATGNVTWGSSREYKENIRDLTSDEALQALNELIPKKYLYKADKKEEHVGFIAEDVPELVATKDRKSLDPMDIVGVLTKVLQEQQRTITTLSDRVSELEKKLKLTGSVALANKIRSEIY